MKAKQYETAFKARMAPEAGKGEKDYTDPLRRWTPLRDRD